MALVVGLGNPGARYARTRHNVAWRVIGRLRARWGAEPLAGPAGRSYETWRATRGEREVVLLVPHTYMNRSGEALAAWRAEHGLDRESLLVVADDVYLPLGALRLRPRGSSGGHRGLASLEAELGDREYARLRVGVGAAESAAALREHVLEEFEGPEEEVVEQTVERAADAVETWLARGLTAAMNAFNRITIEEEQKP